MRFDLRARFSKGTEAEIIVNAPFHMPEPPMPAIARAIISIVDDTDTPQRREPSSKIARNTKKVHCKMVN